MCAGGNLGLESQDVAGLHADLRQRLPVEQLLAAGAVVDFVAERLAVGGVLREVHFLQEGGLLDLSAFASPSSIRQLGGSKLFARQIRNYFFPRYTHRGNLS